MITVFEMKVCSLNYKCFVFIKFSRFVEHLRLMNLKVKLSWFVCTFDKLESLNTTFGEGHRRNVYINI